MTILRKKLHNATTNGESDSINSDQQSQQQLHRNQISPIPRNQSLPNTGGGFGSRLSPGNIATTSHNGYVTMSGPVTDL